MACGRPAIQPLANFAGLPVPTGTLPVPIGTLSGLDWEMIAGRMTAGMRAASDGASVRYPVSVKGVVLRDGRVVLIKNRRDEWELPGGKLEADETPEACVAREIAEELDLVVVVHAIVDAWVYRIAAGIDVLVLTYGCEATAWPATLASPEGNDVRPFALDEIDALPLPEGYRRSIRRWAQAR